MTGKIQRPGEWRTLGDHETRIRILEANPGGDGSDTAIACTGCFEIDPQFADCVDLVGEAAEELGTRVVPDSSPSCVNIAATRLNIGPYRCNYEAGFRLQVFVAAFLDFSAQLNLGNQIRNEDTLGTLSGASWPPLPDNFTGDYNSGWATVLTDPAGAGALGDDWTTVMCEGNSSVLFSATYSGAVFAFRYIQANEIANQIPGPAAEGDMLVASGSPLVWTRISPGAPGEVLTINGSGFPEWT